MGTLRKRREKPGEEHKRVNEEKDRKNQRQEAEVKTGRKKVDKGTIRKVRTQGEIAIKLKPVEEKDHKKVGQQKIILEKGHKNRKYIQNITGER